MRSTLSTPPSKSPSPRLAYVTAGTADAASRSALDVWRMQALRQATAVRRVLRSADVTDGSTVAEAPTLDALEAGRVEELLLTTRFVDLNPTLASRVMRLAHEGNVRVSTLTGAAAFELDLFAGGIAAVLRRSASHPHGRREPVVATHTGV